jgi:dTDP-4-amino-4,6-dideoxygalactose transaminase
MSRALKIRNYGGKAKYEHTTFGFNSRMSEIQASVLNLKLKYLNQWTSERIDIAQKYYNLLKDNPNIYLPKLNFDGSNVFHLFPILVEDRDKIKLKMKESGVDLGIHYPQILPETQAFYKYNYAKSNLKSAKSWADKNITLPIYPGLPDSSIDYVVENLQKNLKN